MSSAYKYPHEGAAEKWDPTMTLRMNCKILNIPMSYAYNFASKNGLKYKKDHRAGYKIGEKPLYFKDPYAPSAQKFAWDECPENLLNEKE